LPLTESRFNAISLLDRAATRSHHVRYVANSRTFVRSFMPPNVIPPTPPLAQLIQEDEAGMCA
jgi:hypothetical protein